jgi:hypothetical protein
MPLGVTGHVPQFHPGKRLLVMQAAGQAVYDVVKLTTTGGSCDAHGTYAVAQMTCR